MKPEFLRTEFLEAKFRNELEFKHSFLEFLKAERTSSTTSAGEASAKAAEEPDERLRLIRVEVPSWTVS